jgi:ketosteroid isomerase-like protein
MVSSVDSTVVATLLRLEQERCRALSEKDWSALDALLSDDYTHVHTTGRVEDKPTYIQGMKARPRETSRGDLTVRIYGDSAVMMGLQTNKTQGPDGTNLMHSQVIQVWVKQGGSWRLVAGQNTRAAE